MHLTSYIAYIYTIYVIVCAIDIDTYLFFNFSAILSDLSPARHSLGEVTILIEELPWLCSFQFLFVQPFWH